MGQRTEKGLEGSSETGVAGSGWMTDFSSPEVRSGMLDSCEIEDRREDVHHGRERRRDRPGLARGVEGRVFDDG